MIISVEYLFVAEAYKGEKGCGCGGGKTHVEVNGLYVMREYMLALLFALVPGGRLFLTVNRKRACSK